MQERMSRGVQSHEIWAAADALLMEGLRPTIERVRQKLGRGSPNTVAPMLEAWFAQLGRRLQGQMGGPGPSDGPAVPQPVLDMAHVLWTAALEQARASADQALQAARAEIEHQRVTLSAAQDALDRDRAALIERQVAMDQMVQLTRNHAAALAQRLSDTEATLTQKEQTLATQGARLEELGREREATQRRQEETLAALAQERCQLEERTAQNERRLLNEIDLARQEAKAARTSLANGLRQKEEALLQAEALVDAARNRQQDAEAARQAAQVRQDLDAARAAELQQLLEAEKKTVQTLQKQLTVALGAFPRPGQRAGRTIRLRKT